MSTLGLLMHAREQASLSWSQPATDDLYIHTIIKVSQVTAPKSNNMEKHSYIVKSSIIKTKTIIHLIILFNEFSQIDIFLILKTDYKSYRTISV